MYVAQISFTLNKSVDADTASDLVNPLLGHLRRNGQVCGHDLSLAVNEKQCVSVVLLPDLDALATEHMNEYVRKRIDALHAAGFAGPIVTIIGEEVDAASTCICSKSDMYVLFTTYRTVSSPVRCGTCFQPVPLYRLPPTQDKD